MQEIHGVHLCEKANLIAKVCHIMLRLPYIIDGFLIYRISSLFYHLLYVARRFVLYLTLNEFVDATGARNMFDEWQQYCRMILDPCEIDVSNFAFILFRQH